MPEELVEESANQLLNYGVLGIFCLFLITLLVILWKHLQKREVDFLQRTDKFIEVTENYAKNEAQQTLVLTDLKSLITTWLNK